MSRSREELVKKIVDKVEDWELTQLLDYVQSDMEEWANQLSDEELIENYNFAVLPEERVTKIG